MQKDARLERKQLIFYLKVIDRNTDKTLGRLVDITTQGLMLISNEPIDVYVDFQISIILPKKVEGNSKISPDITSLWTKKDVNEDFFLTGFKFNYISIEDTNTIEYLIKDMGFE